MVSSGAEQRQDREGVQESRQAVEREVWTEAGAGEHCSEAGSGSR